MANTLPHFINGEFVEDAPKRNLDVRNPATGEHLYQVPVATTKTVAKAIIAAKRAFATWQFVPPVERARILFRYKTLIDKRVNDLAEIICREHGKTLCEARGSIKRGIENIEHACGIPTLMLGDSLENVANGIDTATFKKPLGVFCAVTPCNFPAMVPLWFWPYALMTGNTFILKPSEKVPGASNFQMELCKEAGFPDGVINLVHGDKETVDALLTHDDIAGISFVGSSPVAKYIYEQATKHHKRVQALGGAKNHVVVMPDCNVSQTVATISESAFGCSGQRCLAASIVVLVGDAYDAVLQKLVSTAENMRVGNGMDEKTAIGPLISIEHKHRVVNFIEQGVSEGAKLLLDGRKPEFANTNFIGPSVFCDVNPSMAIMREEIFGPVLCVARAENLDEAIAMIKACPFANAVSLFSNSGKAAQQFKREIGVSMIGINIGVPAPMAFFPFGGAKQSFFGDTKAHGKDAIHFYTDQKVVISRWF